MAYSTCPKCEHRYFELKEVEPSGSRFKMYFVQCSKCGAPAGVTEYFDAGSAVVKQKKQLEDIESRLSQIETYLRAVLQALRQ